jgi:hypothetical protein
MNVGVRMARQTRPASLQRVTIEGLLRGEEEHTTAFCRAKEDKE